MPMSMNSVKRIYHDSAIYSLYAKYGTAIYLKN